jgi:hypothetical protein
MEELLNLFLVLWLLFMIVGVCIIATYMVWNVLKAIYKGDFP